MELNKLIKVIPPVKLLRKKLEPSLVVPNPVKQTVQCVAKFDDGTPAVYELSFSKVASMDVLQFKEKAENIAAAIRKESQELEAEDVVWENLAARSSKMSKTNPIYGIDSPNSLFLDAEKWNMNSFTQAHSIINVKDCPTIPGVHSTYVNVGMMGTWFGIYCEDSDLASMNVLHLGAPKTWYCVPRQEGPKLEQLFKKLVGNKYTCESVMRHKCFLIPPNVLNEHGIQFCKVLQNPGDIIFTMYGAYHFGFNEGFNVCESSNLASPKYRLFHEEAILCSADCL